MKNYNVLVAGAVIYSGLRCEVAKRVVARLVEDEYTEPTMECKFVVPNDGVDTRYQDGIYHLRHALHHMWFELCELGVEVGNIGIQSRYKLG